MYACNCGRIDNVIAGFVRRAGRWGLTVSVLKTKGTASDDSLNLADTAPMMVKLK